jgi:putative transposase
MKKNSNHLAKEHISLEELEELIFKKEKNAKTVNRLHFIRQIYLGKTVKEARLILGVAQQTAYSWLNKWNDYGVSGLNHKKGAGRPPFLSISELKEVDEYIKSNDSLGTNDVHYFIEENFGVDYSPKQVRVIIKKNSILIG